MRMPAAIMIVGCAIAAVAVAGCSSGTARAAGGNTSGSSTGTPTTALAPPRPITSSSGRASRSQTSSRAVPAPPSPTTALPVCASSSLAFEHDPGLEGASGESTATFVLVNRSAKACALNGYPSLRLVSGGHQIGFDYVDGSGPYVTHAAPRTVTVRPGGTAYVMVAKYRCDSGHDAFATAAYLRLPGGTERLVPASEVPVLYRFAHCIGGPTPDPGNTVSISPVESSLGSLSHWSDR